MAEPARTTRWEHRPADGPISWGAAVLVAALAPMLTLITLPVGLMLTPAGWALGGLVLATSVWLLVGAALSALSTHRVARGAGIGLASGAATTIALVIATAGWTS